MAGTLVANTINTDTGLFSTQNAYNGIAKAWVNYNPSTQTIANSFNVSSVTYNTTGQFTVNFTTAMSNANYATLVTSDNGNFGSGGVGAGGVTTYTTTAVAIANRNSSTGYNNGTYIGCAVFSS